MLAVEPDLHVGQKPLHQQLCRPAKADLAGENRAEEGGGRFCPASGQVDAKPGLWPRGRQMEILGRLQQRVGADAKKPSFKRQKIVQDLGHAGRVDTDKDGVVASVRKPLRNDGVDASHVVRWYENVDRCHMLPILNDPQTP
ncbi:MULTISPECIES: hypothetical protein [unclassified Mesorhizobium]|uniref:hypothetical protein n=1 Tax=unclassified Mesorhizobium TaxID=325217 RepID=UPI001ACD5253|nr:MULTISPECIES: hypothetical protein [unclassified Mesorhizobium]MBN9255001.1 hypothetical protein [Mesorhizobium sp.]